jgi:uncharacterized Tic20 family protein
MSDQEANEYQKPEQEMTAPPAGTEHKPSADDRTWGLLSHLSGLVLAIIGPIIIWQTKGKESSYVMYHAKEALNFHITLVLAGIICIPLMFILIGFLLLPVVSIGGLVFTIIAGLKANEGVKYRYPVCVRLVK